MAMIIELKNITKAYEDELVFEDLNLTIDTENDPPLVIRGASGAGKTTLLNILALLDTDFKGTYLIGGVDVLKLSKSNREKYRRKFSYVFQEYFLMENETVYSNIKLPLIYSKISFFKYKEVIEGVMERVGLAAYKNKKVKKLSGGQRQRVSLARAIVSRPDVILLDEPTNSLDELANEEVYELINDLIDQGIYVIIVSHDLDSIEIDKYRLVDIADL